MREDDGDVVSTGKDSGKASGMTADDYIEDSSIASMAVATMTIQSMETMFQKNCSAQMNRILTTASTTTNNSSQVFQKIRVQTIIRLRAGLQSPT
jgi:hypothetical protein